MRFYRTRIREWFIIASIIIIAHFCSFSCYSPKTSQDFFVQATVAEKALQPLYGTALYTVYFDFALQRCVIHAAHTWGEKGGGAGGTGIGVSAFRCDPARIQKRARQYGLKLYKARFDAQNENKENQTRETSQPKPISKEGE